MALEKQDKIKRIEYEAETDCIFIEKETVLVEDGVQAQRLSRHRAPFYPDQLEKLKSHINKPESNEVKFAETIWTPQVVANYQAKKEAQRLAEEAKQQQGVPL